MMPSVKPRTMGSPSAGHIRPDQACSVHAPGIITPCPLWSGQSPGPDEKTRHRRPGHTGLAAALRTQHHRDYLNHTPLVPSWSDLRWRGWRCSSASYRHADNTWTGRHPWGDRSFHPDWTPFVEQATIRQLLLFGFPPPGHPYWTPETIQDLQVRYPGLDTRRWRPDSLRNGPGRMPISSGEP
jgi:hypothetical protein